MSLSGTDKRIRLRQQGKSHVCSPCLLGHRISCTALVLSVLLFAVGCAFDISHVRQQPAQFTAVAAPVREFTLNREVKAKLGTGFPTVLKAGTRWRLVGRIAPGEVFAIRNR